MSPELLPEYKAQGLVQDRPQDSGDIAPPLWQGDPEREAAPQMEEDVEHHDGGPGKACEIKAKHVKVDHP